MIGEVWRVSLSDLYGWVGDSSMGMGSWDGLSRFITGDLGNARRTRCRWDLEGFDGWEVRDRRGLISGVEEIGTVMIGS